MRGEELAKMVGRKVTGAIVGGQLLRTHHGGFDDRAQEHDNGQYDVHDADLLVIDTGEPVCPERLPPLHDGEQYE